MGQSSYTGQLNRTSIAQARNLSHAAAKPSENLNTIRTNEPVQYIDFSDPNYVPGYLKTNHITKQRHQAVTDK